MKEKIKWRIYPFGAICHYCYHHNPNYKRVYILDEKNGYCRKCIREGKHKLKQKG